MTYDLADLEAAGVSLYQQGVTDQGVTDAAAIAALEQTIAADQALIDDLRRQLAECQCGDARFPGDPGAGKILCGVKVDDNGNDPSSLEGELGFVDDLHRLYFVPGEEAAMIARCRTDIDTGRLPWASMHTPTRWASVTDTWLHSCIDGLAAIGKPLWFTLDHEPWDDQATKGTPAEYVAMYRRAYAMTKGSNIALTPVLQSWPFFSWIPNQDKGIANWYDPEACDILGLDGYNPWFVKAKDSAWHTPAQLLDVATQLQAAYPGKPIAFGEWGVRTDPRTRGKAAQWMLDYYETALSMGLAGICYYSSGLNSPNGPWTLDAERKAAFKTMVHDPRTVSGA